jgi:hypothetical protein
MGGLSKSLEIGGALLVMGVAIFFPLFYNPSPTFHGRGGGEGEIPEVEFFDGKFKLYNGKGVAKRGNYSILQKFQNRYVGRVLFVHNLENGYYATAQKGILRGEKLFLTKFKIWNPDYILKSPNGIYNLKKRYLEGKEFTFNSPSTRGSGHWFRVWENKRIEAKKVHYFLKEEPPSNGKGSRKKG